MDRIKFFQIVIFVVAAIVILRLFYWQFLAKNPTEGQTYSEESKIPAARGQIYAADGFPLVTNQEAFLLYGKPGNLNDSPQKIAQTLAPYLISEKYATASGRLSDEEEKSRLEEIRQKEKDLQDKLSNRFLIWVQLARKVPLAVKEKIQVLDLAGLGFERDEKRLYPEASMAAQLLGFVGSDKFGDDTGYFGLDGYYDRQLRGK